ncbi:(2Fe-2S) ferredoxin domain-containing protein [Pedobacter jamesrossensis]
MVFIVPGGKNMAIKDLTIVKTHLFMCNGGSCKSKGSEESIVEIRKLIEEAGIGETIHTTKTLCNGRCNDGPIVIAMPRGFWFSKLTVPRVKDWIDGFIIRGETPTENLLFTYGSQEINNAQEGD